MKLGIVTNLAQIQRRRPKHFALSTWEKGYFKYFSLNLKLYLSERRIMVSVKFKESITEKQGSIITSAIVFDLTNRPLI